LSSNGTASFRRPLFGEILCTYYQNGLGADMKLPLLGAGPAKNWLTTDYKCALSLSILSLHPDIRASSAGRLPL
jgi:hypothetical protein